MGIQSPVRWRHEDKSTDLSVRQQHPTEFWDTLQQMLMYENLTCSNQGYGTKVSANIFSDKHLALDSYNKPGY